MTLSRTNVALGALILGLALGAGGVYLFRLSPADHSEHEAHEEHHEHAAQSGDTHDEHGHGEHEGPKEGVVKLSPKAMKLYGIEVAEAGGGKLERTVTLPCEVTLDADRLAHIVPRVGGIAREVRKRLGDHMEAGEILAILDSRELAEAKSACIAGQARYELAQANFVRAETLFNRKIAPEEDFLKAKQGLAEADIDHRTAEAKLHALGLTEEQVLALHGREKDVDYPRYEIKVPFAGTIIEKHITLGELVGSEGSVFVLGDLSTVWIDITLYTHDSAHVEVGTEVLLSAESFTEPVPATVSYVSPTVSETTRTAFARVSVANPERKWKPGMFCTATVAVSAEAAEVLVPDSALQTIDGETVIFVESPGGFTKQSVTVGRTAGHTAEILSGLVPGDRYVSQGSFFLKAELAKGEASHEH